MHCQDACSSGTSHNSLAVSGLWQGCFQQLADDLPTCIFQKDLVSHRSRIIARKTRSISYCMMPAAVLQQY